MPISSSRTQMPMFALFYVYIYMCICSILSHTLLPMLRFFMYIYMCVHMFESLSHHVCGDFFPPLVFFLPSSWHRRVIPPSVFLPVVTRTHAYTHVSLFFFHPPHVKCRIVSPNSQKENHRRRVRFHNSVHMRRIVL